MTLHWTQTHHIGNVIFCPGNVASVVGAANPRMLVVFSLGSAFAFAWIYVGKGLLSRLSTLNESILALAGGNLEVEIPHGGHDELSGIATAVEVFKRHAIEARGVINRFCWSPSLGTPNFHRRSEEQQKNHLVKRLTDLGYAVQLAP